ncbi:DUF3656 domain-containing U32 family peptidase [Aneurinibacillus sp. Ricciae_BoGa-3]|uniref:DUF3656 domain-containing U32 family peptidase n=1 Tax=Aneurinibacillus sp. Ricciae_BoGa-3 TaxID=3022697 RepID=UPI003FA48D39
MDRVRKATRDSIELLAPAGNWDCMKAAVANGANAVFFGVEKFNARARADNFKMDDLPEIMGYLHRYGVKGYLTFNILVFEDELRDASELVDVCIEAGVDAVIVQDMGLVELIREISPDFPIHGSTQMTITSPEAVNFVDEYGMEVVVLGRENNLKQIRTIAEKTTVPLEVFVHGALCVSYSGQCLTSEMWGGRSANRGECAQACRLPYDLIVDGVQKEMGDIAYLLSPKDLAAIDLIPELIETGVSSFKIEGRLKSPEYVANVVGKYRRAIDAYFEGENYHTSMEDMRELQQSFSRGFTHGFLKGTNNKQLVDGTFPKSRGVYLGMVKKKLKDAVICELEAPLKRGDGIVFDAGKPQEKEEGGRVYDLRKNGRKVEGEVAAGIIEIVPGRNDVRLNRVQVGDKIWKTNDPELDRRLRKTFEHDRPFELTPISVTAYGSEGKPLNSVWLDTQTGAKVIVTSSLPLETAIKRPLTEEYLMDQWGRLGGTVYELSTVEMQMDKQVILPVKELNRIRRAAVEQLMALRELPRRFTKTTTLHENESIESSAALTGEHTTRRPELIVLCRTMEQIHAATRTDVDYLYADFEFIKDYPAAVSAAHQFGKKIALATPRIHMPGENGVLNAMLKAAPDAILVRNLGALNYFNQMQTSLPLIGDFSLNIANHKAVDVFLEQGLTRVTPSYDLNIQQMVDMLEKSRVDKIELVIHQHLPMFHTEHCVYCTFLSDGTDYTNCGRPCESHRVSLQDRIGMSHPVRVDTGCRNTVYNAIEQSGAEYISHFLELGVRDFRIEFLEESEEMVHEVIRLYRQALDGKRTGTSVWKSLKATNQLGVTRGQLIKK